jgi:SRSO17 transposase
LERYLTG